MKNTILAIGLGLIIGLSSCDKDQKALKNVAEYNWDITDVTDSDGNDFIDAVSGFTGGATFSECKQKDGDCDGTLYYDYTITTKFNINGNESTQTLNYSYNLDFTYNISSEGASLNITKGAEKLDVQEETSPLMHSSSYDNAACTQDCSITGTINEDYSKITLTMTDGSVVVIESKESADS